MIPEESFHGSRKRVLVTAAKSSNSFKQSKTIGHELPRVVSLFVSNGEGSDYYVIPTTSTTTTAPIQGKCGQADSSHRSSLLQQVTLLSSFSSMRRGLVCVATTNNDSEMFG